MMDTIESLSNDELREELMKFGVKPGPVVGTTRTVYIAKLRKLMAAADTDQPSRNDESHHALDEHTPPRRVNATAAHQHNGDDDDEMYEGEESSRLIDTELSPPFAESTTNEFDDDDDIGYRRQPMATRTTTQYRSGVSPRFSPDQVIASGGGQFSTASTKYQDTYTTPLASYGTGGGSSLFKRSTAFGSNTGSSYGSIGSPSMYSRPAITTGSRPATGVTNSKTMTVSSRKRSDTVWLIVKLTAIVVLAVFIYFCVTRIASIDRHHHTDEDV